MKLFVGLGNPGSKYETTRHNIGFMAVDEIQARAGSFVGWKHKFQGEFSKGTLGDEKCILLKPSTFMNESGRSVAEAAKFFKIASKDIVVFHDELDLPPGKMKVKTGGGHAGHNGLRSIIAQAGGPDFMRVRIGIGHPGRKELVSGYVLHEFSKADQDWIEPLIDAMGRYSHFLADGDAPRFMSDIARFLQPEKKANKPKQDEDNKQPQPAKKKAKKPFQVVQKDDGKTGNPFADALKKSEDEA